MEQSGKSTLVPGHDADSGGRDQDATGVRHAAYFEAGQIVKSAFPLKWEYGKNMPQRKMLQYQKQFNLPNTEVTWQASHVQWMEAGFDLTSAVSIQEVLGRYMCVHLSGANTVPTQGDFFITTSNIVFRSNILGYLQTMMIPFKMVEVIRKRTTMMLPNTIAIEHQSGPGEPRQKEVFTNFFFSSRDAAFDTLLEQWRAARPAPEPTAGQIDDDLDDEVNVGGLPPLIPVPADKWPEIPGGMELLLQKKLPGIDPTTLAEVLLADSSGFTPALAEEEGNEPKNMSPWKPCPSKYSSSSSGGAVAAERIFQYIYKGRGPMGAFKSRSTVEQKLTRFEGGRLLMDGVQKMPGLPNGVGRCFHIEVRWEVLPLNNGCLRASPPPSPMAAASSTAPTTAAAAEAAVGDWDLPSACNGKTSNSVTAATGQGGSAVIAAEGASGGPSTTACLAPIPVEPSLQGYLKNEAAGVSTQTTPSVGNGMASGLSITLGGAAAAAVGDADPATPSDKSAGSTPLATSARSWLGIPVSPKGSSVSLFGGLRRKPAGMPSITSGSGSVKEENQQGGDGGNGTATAATTEMGVVSGQATSAAGKTGDVRSFAELMEPPALAIQSLASCASGPFDNDIAQAASATAGDGGGCLWRVWFGVRFTSSTLLKARIERDTFTTARLLYESMGEMAEKWLRNAGVRKSMAEVLPHADSVRKAVERDRRRRAGHGSDGPPGAPGQEGGGDGETSAAPGTAAVSAAGDGSSLRLKVIVTNLLSSFGSSRRDREEGQESSLSMLLLLVLLLVGLLSAWLIWQLLQVQRQVWGVQQQVLVVQQQVLGIQQQIFMMSQRS